MELSWGCRAQLTPHGNATARCEHRDSTSQGLQKRGHERMRQPEPHWESDAFHEGGKRPSGSSVQPSAQHHHNHPQTTSPGATSLHLSHLCVVQLSREAARTRTVPATPLSLLVLPLPTEGMCQAGVPLLSSLTAEMCIGRGWRSFWNSCGVAEALFCSDRCHMLRNDVP